MAHVTATDEQLDQPARLVTQATPRAHLTVFAYLTGYRMPRPRTSARLAALHAIKIFPAPWTTKRAALLRHTLEIMGATL